MNWYFLKIKQFLSSRKDLSQLIQFQCCKIYPHVLLIQQEALPFKLSASSVLPLRLLLWQKSYTDYVIPIFYACFVVNLSSFSMFVPKYFFCFVYLHFTWLNLGYVLYFDNSWQKTYLLTANYTFRIYLSTNKHTKM